MNIYTKCSQITHQYDLHCDTVVMQYLIAFILGTFTLLVVLISIVILLWYYKYLKFFKYGIYKFTGPSCAPVLGHVLKLKYDTSTMNYLLGVCKRHNGIARMMGGFNFAILVTDYKLTEFILTSNVLTKKAFVYDFARNWLGSGLVIADGLLWKKKRRIITPAFHFEILNQFIEVFDSKSDILVKKFYREMNSSDGMKRFECYNYIPHCTLDAICETAMRSNLNIQESAEHPYMKAVKLLSTIIMYRSIDPFKHNNFMYKFTSLHKLEQKSLKVAHQYTESVIKRRRKEYEKEMDESRAGNVKKVSFIDVLMGATIDGKRLTDKEIRDEVETFMFAGFDTTSQAISFALYSIAKYPHIQGKVIEEQRKIFLDDRCRRITQSDLNKMKYLDMVVKETLRLYPSAPSIPREVAKDFEYDGMVFKKGLQIVLFVYGLHRNPDYHPNPDIFDPERFSNEFNKGLYPYGYIPFSVGPRNCIGKRFALLEIKTIISKIVRNFVLHPCTDHVLQPIQKITVVSMSGIPIILQKRQW